MSATGKQIIDQAASIAHDPAPGPHTRVVLTYDPAAPGNPFRCRYRAVADVAANMITHARREHGAGSFMTGCLEQQALRLLRGTL